MVRAKWLTFSKLRPSVEFLGKPASLHLDARCAWVQPARFRFRTCGALNGEPIEGVLVATSGDPCWPDHFAMNFIDVFRADVTGIAQPGANLLSEFPSGAASIIPSSKTSEVATVATCRQKSASTRNTAKSTLRRFLCDQHPNHRPAVAD